MDEEYLRFLAQEDADLGEVNPYGFFPQDFRYPRNTLTQNIPIATAQNPAMVNYNGIMGTDQANMFYDRGELDELTEAMPEEDNQEKGGIARLFELYQKFSPINFLGQLLPEQDPRAINMRNFYGSQYGLTPTGSLASGIMAGYNPISGGLLNMITGGRFGRPTQYGLADAARRRIERIANRKVPQTIASRARIAALQEFADRDTINRARQAAPDVYRSAEGQGFTGPRGGFSTSGREGAFSSKTGRGRQDY